MKSQSTSSVQVSIVEYGNKSDTKNFRLIVCFWKILNKCTDFL